MEQAATHPIELAGAWRRAALVAVGIAALELLALLGIGVALLGGPIAHRLRAHARAQAAAAPAAKHVPARQRPVIHKHRVAKPRLARGRTVVLVLNGNGRQGAASVEASRLRARGYRVGATGNAQRMDYATSMVMFRRGYEPEARRLARDAGIRVVAPLDGLRPGELKGAHLAVVVGN